MKKNRIRLLVAVMFVALLGLLGIQWSWVKNAVTLKETQFKRDVYDAMLMVSERLQDRETAMLFTAGGPMSLASTMMNGGQQFAVKGKLGDPPKSVSTRERPNFTNVSLEPEAPRPKETRYRTVTRFVNGEPVERVEEYRIQDDSSSMAEDRLIAAEMQASLDYLENVFDRVFKCKRPIAERVNAALLDSLLRYELRNRNIDEDFVHNINRHGPLEGLLVGGDASSKIDSSLPVFRVLLFPHDISPGHHFLELQFPDHHNSTVRAMGILLPTSGVLVMVVVLCFGIAIFAWQRQQKLSTLKTDFINNMTHELKTPISTISLALEALGDPDMQSASNIGTYTAMIQQENDRLKTQVERVLQAAAFERGELQLNLIETDFRDVIENEVTRIQIHVERRGGQIEFVNAATDPIIMADKMHLAGIVFNLLDNANKYSPNAPQISVRLENNANGIALHVKDKGIGMNREEQRRIFEKFYRVPTGDVHDVKGFGLGLNYVRTIALAHNGNIQVNSEVGKGTEFILQLPSKVI